MVTKTPREKPKKKKVTQLGTRSLNGKRHPATDRPSGKKQIHNSRPASCHDVVSIVFSLTNDNHLFSPPKTEGATSQRSVAVTPIHAIAFTFWSIVCVLNDRSFSHHSSPQTKKYRDGDIFFSFCIRGQRRASLSFFISIRTTNSAKNGVIQLRHRAPPPRPIVVALRDDGERRVRPRRRFQSVPDE